MKPKHSRPFSVGTAAAVVALSVAFLAPHGLAAKTMQEAVQTTLATNPEIAAIRSNRRAVEQELRQARGLYYPSVDLRGTFGHELSDNPATRGRATRGPGKSGKVNLTRYETSATITQLLFDGGGVGSGVERQLARVSSARFRVFDTAEAVALRTVEAYIEILRTQETLRIGEENVKAHEKILTRVTARSRGGRGPRSDVDQASARVASAKAALALTRGTLEDAMANYLSVVGEPPENLSAVKAPELELPSNVDEAVALALDSAPAISAAEADIKTGNADIGISNANFWPRIDLEASTSHNRNLDGVRGRNNDYLGQLVMTYNLYRGGIDVARKREALQRLAQARDVLDLARREVEEQTRLSWNALNAARERRVALQGQVTAIQKVLEAYTNQFNLGQRTLLDLLDIQNELFVTRTTLVTEGHTVSFGVYRTLASMGQLLKTVGVALPAEAVRPAK